MGYTPFRVDVFPCQCGEQGSDAIIEVFGGWPTVINSASHRYILCRRGISSGRVHGSTSFHIVFIISTALHRGCRRINRSALWEEGKASIILQEIKHRRSAPSATRPSKHRPTVRQQCESN